MNVHDYTTGALIETNARFTETLAAATAEDETGAVCAYRNAAGVWQYVSQADAAHHRDNLGRDVRTVYLSDAELTREPERDPCPVALTP